MKTIESLENELNEYKLLFDTSNLVVFKWENKEGWPVVSVSSSIESLLGYTKNDFISGKVVYSELIHSEDIAFVSEEVRSNSEQQLKNFTHQPYRIKSVYGEYIWVQDTTYIIYDDSYNITHYFGFIFDITLEKEAKDRLFDLEGRYKLAIEATRDGLWDWNPVTNEVFFSKHWKSMLGYSEDEIVNELSSWSERVHPNDLESAMEDVTKHLEGISDYYVNEHRMLCKDGSYKWILDRGKAIHNEDGIPIRFIGFHTDIDEQKRDKEKIVELANAKSNFLSSMSHEIRTPLNAIFGFINLLLKEDITPKQEEYLSIIKSSSSSLLVLIDDILDFSKMEAGKLQLEEKVFYTKEPFEESCLLFFEKAKEKNITLVCDIDSTLPKYCKSDITRLKQVVSNLLSNAIKFTPENGEIRIEVKYMEKTHQLYFSIHDNGIGIAQDALETIFNPFLQENSSTTREFGGTGLGLSISHEIIMALGSKLQVNSVKGEFTTFSFVLDIFTDEEVEQDGNDINTNNVLRGDILIVEDNVTNGLLLQLMLEEYNLTTTIVYNGQEALDITETQTFDMILMDENMPVLNGIEATKIFRAREKERHTPIIAVTANALKGDKERFLSIGADDYIAKPIEEKVLVNILIKYLDS